MTKFEILVARAQHAQDQCHAAEESGDKVKHLKALLTWAEVQEQLYREAKRIAPRHPKLHTLLPEGWKIADLDKKNRAGKIASLVRQYVEAGVCDGTEFPGINWR